MAASASASAGISAAARTGPTVRPSLRPCRAGSPVTSMRGARRPSSYRLVHQMQVGGRPGERYDGAFGGCDPGGRQNDVEACAIRLDGEPVGRAKENSRANDAGDALPAFTDLDLFRPQ